MNVLTFAGCVTIVLLILCGSNYAAGLFVFGYDNSFRKPFGRIKLQMVFIYLVTGLGCADYHGSGAKIALDSSHNDDDTSAEYEDDNERNFIKTEKVNNETFHSFFFCFFIKCIEICPFY